MPAGGGVRQAVAQRASTRAGARCGPDESVTVRYFLALRGLQRETGIHFRCNSR
jgi:hypothetical protein